MDKSLAIENITLDPQEIFHMFSLVLCHIILSLPGETASSQEASARDSACSCINNCATLMYSTRTSAPCLLAMLKGTGDSESNFLQIVLVALLGLVDRILDQATHRDTSSPPQEPM
jgi:hypothetical protein